ncbi:MAG: IS4 family transposase, partial [Planctomycetota bacterium]
MATKTIKEGLAEPTKLAFVKQILRSEKHPSRTRLAETLCRRFRLRDQQGKLRVSSCLKSLRDLEREGRIRLPPRLLNISSQWRPRRLAAAVPKPKGVPGEVAELEGLDLVLVDPNDETAMRTWNELIIREHPQGKRRLVGRQLRYLVGSSHGWLGAVGFSASALTLAARDRWIGWDAPQRREHQHRVVNLSRLLIRPGVHCRNLASTVLGACLRRLAVDFERRYGYRPWLVETFVDRERYRGTCFQAANWERIGETKGRGRNDREHRESENVKDIQVYPLVKDFRRRMGVPSGGGSHIRPLAVEDGLGSGEWAESEFGKVELGDKRLRDRLIKIASDRSQKPDASYLDACGGDRYAAKGYYYFVDGVRDELNPEAILAAHRERTIGRMMSHKMVLVVQDTTDLNFSSRHHTTGLGLIGTNQTGAQSLGLKLHSSLALTTDGLPLGVLRSVSFAPEPKGKSGKQSIGRPIEDKKSFRWLEGHRDCVSVAKKMPKTRLLTVMDREGDIFELFMDAEATRKRVGVLVRAKHNRCLEGGERKLFETLKASKNRERIEVMIPRQRWKEAKRGKPQQKGLPGREATMELCYQEVSIESTRSDLRSAEPITLWGVYARETNPPAGAKRIEWFLLTTEPVRSAEEAARVVDLYCKRWRIEEWHRVLKSGCKVQEHQNETAERLKRVIAIDAVLAWRIQLMTLLGREVPDLPCAVFFDEWEVRVLEALRKKNAKGKKKKAVGKSTHPLRLG